MPELLAKFRALSLNERALLIEAAALVPFIALGVRVWGLKRMVRRLEARVQHRTVFESTAEAVLRARRIYTLLWWVKRYGPYRGNCLSQSLTLWWLLRRQGIDGDLRIGVRKTAGQFFAHAWVEYMGEPVNDRADIGTRYAVFEQALLPAIVDWS